MNIRKTVSALMLVLAALVAVSACSSGEGSRAGESQNVDAADVAPMTKTPEGTYLATLEGQGVPYTTAEKAVNGGKTICKLLDEGNEWFPLAFALYAKWGPQGDNTKPLTQTQIGVVMRASVYNFCPQHINLIPQ